MEARDLPVMDSRSELTDAYVEIKFGDELHRTNVCRRTLCPVWNADFRFEAEDTEIQDEVLEARYTCSALAVRGNIIGTEKVGIYLGRSC